MGRNGDQTSERLGHLEHLGPAVPAGRVVEMLKALKALKMTATCGNAVRGHVTCVARC